MIIFRADIQISDDSHYADSSDFLTDRQIFHNSRVLLKVFLLCDEVKGNHHHYLSYAGMR